MKGNQQCPTCAAVLLVEPIFFSPPQLGTAGAPFGPEVLWEDALATPAIFPQPMSDTL